MFTDGGSGGQTSLTPNSRCAGEYAQPDIDHSEEIVSVLQKTRLNYRSVLTDVYSMRKIIPTGRERSFGEHELIVSKTDPRGIITYANSVFCRVSGYQDFEILGKPHNLVRHPEMPRGVFRLLWDRLESGCEIFAMVVNLASNGDHYWVLAHVTPSISPEGKLLGYHSNRRLPQPQLVREFSALYRQMIEVEAGHSNPKKAAQASLQFLLTQLEKSGKDYDEFMFSRLNKALERETV